MKFISMFKIIITLSLICLSNLCQAWPTDNKIEKSAKTNQTIVLFKLFLYDAGRGCIQLPAPQATAEGEKLGKVITKTGRQKLTPNIQACGKEIESDYVEWVYVAGNQSGVDKFKIYYHDGAGFKPIDVVVNIGGQSTIQHNELLNTEDKNKTSKNNVIASNPIFDKIKIGSSFVYNTENLITGKKGNFSLIVSDKQDNDFSTISGPGLIIFNPNFERIKTTDWKYHKRSCDGINFPLKIGGYEKFNYSGTYIKDGANNNRNFLCERKTLNKKFVIISGKSYEGWIVENTNSSKWNNGDNSVYKWVGTFSEEIGTWLEISITEKIEGRTTINLKWELSKYEIPEKEYQIKTTMCSGSCDTAAENQKASILDNKKFKNKNECDQNLNEFGKKETLPVPNPTSFIYACVEAK